MLCFGWWPSLRLGSILVRDAVTEVIKAAAMTDPGDEAAWEESVTQPALALDDALADVAAGWGRGLECFTMTFWLIGLAYFAFALNTPHCEAIEARIQAGEMDDPNSSDTHQCTFQRAVNLGIAALFALMPLGLGWDIATTSSRCGAHMAVPI